MEKKRKRKEEEERGRERGIGREDEDKEEEKRIGREGKVKGCERVKSRRQWVFCIKRRRPPEYLDFIYFCFTSMFLLFFFFSSSILHKYIYILSIDQLEILPSAPSLH